MLECERIFRRISATELSPSTLRKPGTIGAIDFDLREGITGTRKGNSHGKETK